MFKKEGFSLYHEKNEHGREFYLENIETITAKVENSPFKLGEGKTAQVKVLEADDAICLKAVFDKTQSVNRVNDEMEFLDKLSDQDFLNGIGIKRRIVPAPKFSLQTAKNDYLFQEKIKGFTVAQLIDGNLFDRLPASFDLEAFFDDLEDIITKLNKQGGIHHRDLCAKNIMIEEESGLSILIDFGDAIESFISDEDPYRQEDFRGTVTVFTPDIENLKKIRKEALKAKSASDAQLELAAA